MGYVAASRLTFVGEVSLRDVIRSGAPSMVDPILANVIDAAVKNKKFALGGHGDMHGIAESDNRSMILIGG